MARVAAGRLCDVQWINTIFIYQFGTLLVGFVTLVLPVIQSYKGIAIFVVFYGLGDGIFITTMNSLLMFTVDEKRRAAALGLGNTLLSIGVAAGPPLAGDQAWAILFHIYIFVKLTSIFHVCPVIDHEFRLNIVKVAVDLRSRVDLQTTLTML